MVDRTSFRATARLRLENSGLRSFRVQRHAAERDLCMIEQPEGTKSLKGCLKMSASMSYFRRDLSRSSAVLLAALQQSRSYRLAVQKSALCTPELVLHRTTVCTIRVTPSHNGSIAKNGSNSAKLESRAHLSAEQAQHYCRHRS